MHLLADPVHAGSPTSSKEVTESMRHEATDSVAVKELYQLDENTLDWGKNLMSISMGVPFLSTDLVR